MRNSDSRPKLNNRALPNSMFRFVVPIYSASMNNDEIRTIIERNVKAVTLRPSIGQHTGRTNVRLKPGLECEVIEGPWRLTVAMGEKSGGTNAGPSPGVLGRGALGSCLALGYAM